MELAWLNVNIDQCGLVNDGGFVQTQGVEYLSILITLSPLNTKLCVLQAFSLR